jgi:hypothetical protein
MSSTPIIGSDLRRVPSPRGDLHLCRTWLARHERELLRGSLVLLLLLVLLHWRS